MAVPIPSTAIQRALAYAPKPFAALSFLSSLFTMYYLLVRHPEKRRRMYHRLILSTFVCVLPLSLVMFWGTWAMPVGSAPWAAGVVGTSTTCSVSGFIYAIFVLAFPFYNASFGVYAYVAVKNDFKEEKYSWMEKWIHFGAYLPPLILAIISATRGWLQPGLAHCTIRIYEGCQNALKKDCFDEDNFTMGVSVSAIILFELLVGTFTIIYLVCRFDKIRRDTETATGMKQIIEKARKQMLGDVALQTSLYLASFWFGYLPEIVKVFLRTVARGKVNWGLLIASDCCMAFQGFVVMAVYFSLQERLRNTVAPVPGADGGRATANAKDTVSQIRANAARPRRSLLMSSKKLEFSFHIFDGTPAEDSPWAKYLDGGSSDLSGKVETVVEDDEDDGGDFENGLTSSLLPATPGRSLL